MSNKLESMMEKIVNKKFGKRTHSGYDPEDVDSFFDDVIAYLKEINEEIIISNNKISSLKKEVDEWKDKCRRQDDVINTKNQEINYFHQNGYGNIRLSGELTELRQKLAKLEGEKK